MAAPARTNDLEANLELLTLANEARHAEGRLWMTAAAAVRDERLTAKAAAAILKVSEATFWRKVKPWNEHHAQGPGIGR
jgi:hypothetical protein